MATPGYLGGSERDASVRTDHRLSARHGWLNSNKGTKSDMGVCPSHSALESYTYVEPPIIGPIQAANFGSLIPTESRRLSPEICCHESPRRWRLLAGASLSSLRACWLMAPARSLSPDYHTTGADLCTTVSKKYELNLSKATLCRRNFYVAFGTFVGI